MTVLTKIICRLIVAHVGMIEPGEHKDVSMATSNALRVVRGRSQAATLLHDGRRELLQHLSEPQSAAGLARKLGTSRQRVRYHLAELEKAGLVELVAERRSGNCVERVVRATARSFVISPEALGSLGDTPEESSDRFSAAYLIGSAARTLRDVGALDARARALGKRLSTLTLESEIRFATPEARSAFAAELSNAVAAIIAKYHDDNTPTGRRYRLTSMLHPTLVTDPAPESSPKEMTHAQADGG